MPDRPTFILVHGGWHGAWCWAALEPKLQERGIATHAVELTSHGTDPAAVGDLRSDTELVRRTATDVGGPVVLLGHSYGGLVITEAAEGLSNVSQLYYLAAFFPDIGDSMRKLTGGGRAPWLNFSDGLMSVAPGWGSKLFYSDCAPAVAADAEARLLPQSAESFAQEVQVTPWRTIRSTYFICTEDQAVPPQSQRRWAAMVHESVELRSGHSPMLSQPDRLADILVERLV
jgi:pimeloyl-ACP methyl ester carboxylesterase